MKPLNIGWYGFPYWKGLSRGLLNSCLMKWVLPQGPSDNVCPGIKHIDSYALYFARNFVPFLRQTLNHFLSGSFRPSSRPPGYSLLQFSFPLPFDYSKAPKASLANHKHHKRALIIHILSGIAKSQPESPIFSSQKGLLWKILQRNVYSCVKTVPICR